MSYLRWIFFLAWLFFTCTIGLFACLFRPFGVDANIFTARLFSWLALRICRLQLTVEGRENIPLNTPCLIVANHQSAVDMATYGAIIPAKTRAIGKTELRWIPIFGFFMWFAGNVLINRQRKDKAISGLDKAVARIRSEGLSIFIFPEGTRNTTGGGLLPFKKGAFHMAIAAGVPILPMVSSSLKGIAIFEKAELPGGHVTLKILPPIATTNLSKDDVERLSQTVREKMLAAMATPPSALASEPASA